MKLHEFTKGIIKENPVLVLLYGMCPTLAVTTSAFNGVGMGVAFTFVLLLSNITISLIKNLIPDQVRIPAFIVVIASFVTIVDLLLSAYSPGLHKTLGIFIPLIVVNCIILGRAEAFASKNTILPSILDALGMGVGFTMALFILGSIREILGSGSWFGLAIMETKTLVMLMPPGAFIALGFILALSKKLGFRD